MTWSGFVKAVGTMAAAIIALFVLVIGAILIGGPDTDLNWKILLPSGAAVAGMVRAARRGHLGDTLLGVMTAVLSLLSMVVLGERWRSSVGSSATSVAIVYFLLLTVAAAAMGFGIVTLVRKWTRSIVG